MAGRSCPVRCVLYLNCDPHEVDINVHPRKDEVRFHEARLVHDVLLETVANSLRKELRSVDDGLKKSRELMMFLPLKIKIKVLMKIL